MGEPTVLIGVFDLTPMDTGKDRYVATLVSGYALVILQIGLSLVSVPLSLKYLGKEGFGVWALASQVSAWLLMLDAGMNGALARYLIDYRNKTDGTDLKHCIATGFQVLTFQGIAILLASVLLASFAGPAFGLDAQTSVTFGKVLLALGAATCVSFVGKIIASWLYACQRLDICNINTVVLVVGEFLVFWLLLRAGFGIYALVWSRLFNTLGASLLGWWLGIKVTKFPVRMLFGAWNGPMFRRLASFGGGMFLLTLGTQLLTMTQTVLVSKHLGLIAAAVWATAPKLYQVVVQIVSKLWDYRIPHFSTLMAKNEIPALTSKFCAIFRATSYIGGGSLGVVVAMNPLFLALWTNHAISWNHCNDGILALVIYFSLIIRCITDFVLHTKKIGWMPLLMFSEGVLFVIAATLLLPRFGISGMLIASLIAGGLLRLPYAWHKFREFLTLSGARGLAIAGDGMGGLLFGIFMWLLMEGIVLTPFFHSMIFQLAGQALVAGIIIGPLAYRLIMRPAERDPDTLTS